MNKYDVSANALNTYFSASKIGAPSGAPMVMKQCLKQIKDLKSEISQWQESAWNFFHKNDISDAEEFITGRTGYLRFFLIN